MLMVVLSQVETLYSKSLHTRTTSVKNVYQTEKHFSPLKPEPCCSSILNRFLTFRKKSRLIIAVNMRKQTIYDLLNDPVEIINPVIDKRTWYSKSKY